MIVHHACSRVLSARLSLALLCALTGCAGGGTSAPTPPQIAVSLSMPTVTVPQTGMDVIVPIHIASPSETAVVMFSGLPGGVQVGYAASDTSPSGDLTFKGDSSTPLGTYMPTINVSSAGGMASTQFTLVVVK